MSWIYKGELDKPFEAEIVKKDNYYTYYWLNGNMYKTASYHVFETKEDAVAMFCTQCRCEILTFNERIAEANGL